MKTPSTSHRIYIRHTKTQEPVTEIPIFPKRATPAPGRDVPRILTTGKKVTTKGNVLHLSVITVRVVRER